MYSFLFCLDFELQKMDGDLECATRLAKGAGKLIREGHLLQGENFCSLEYGFTQRSFRLGDSVARLRQHLLGSLNLRYL